jgi:rod shape-determining protein MreC
MSPNLQRRPRYYLIERPIVFIISTVQSGITSTKEGISRIWNGYINLVRVQEENKRLKKDVETLKAENNNYKEMVYSFERMQALLSFKETAPFKTISARITGKDASNLFKTFTINRGEKDGIKKDMVAIAPEGIVGRVIRTSGRSSLVLLSIDRNSEIAAIIQRTRDEGIVEGKGSSLAHLKYIPTLSDIKEGDAVITSGLDGIYPKGLNIGKVMSVKRGDADLFLERDVLPDTDFSKIVEFLVIIT